MLLLGDRGNSTLRPQKPIDTETEFICSHISEVVKEQKLFLTQRYSINDLSKDTGIPVYKISRAINSCNQTNFNQWINQFRIEEFQVLIEQGYQDQLTLDVIAEKCGFSNRATFISAFKKVKGVTPGVYIKNQMTPIS
ncbi:helix-turn-helix domain-containing protein [Algoriphagus zhangzhouensis]|uniref:AraC-type DNA-binding protein n=1 Tax=Algoriphagus zhangzhouensis TaxID=1073327 RepID=A0A1M7ZHS0_9BACT|nr:AraC family transcriptional regulator [Algoriphagus zhangzhouensis]TDY44204.1 AraC-like DNA-binding protein [Algoriphagus zhangzhouensis]SHO64379.1 AraC-type DNA-binding protein [Algoriphagus zhangzhouensis]